MGPGAEPGFSFAFFPCLVALGLARPVSIVAGIAAGPFLRRLWLAIDIRAGVAATVKGVPSRHARKRYDLIG